MTRQELCPTVKAYRTHKVAKQKPVPVTVYDYYDQSKYYSKKYQSVWRENYLWNYVFMPEKDFHKLHPF